MAYIILGCIIGAIAGWVCAALPGWWGIPVALAFAALVGCVAARMDELEDET